jgi:hypothetical protein
VLNCPRNELVSQKVRATTSGRRDGTREFHGIEEDQDGVGKEGLTSTSRTNLFTRTEFRTSFDNIM